MYKMITANDDEVYVDVTAIKVIHKAYHRSEPVSIIDIGTAHNIRIKTPELPELIRIVTKAKYDPDNFFKRELETNLG